MKNFEKYKTIDERKEAFWKQYTGNMHAYDAVWKLLKWLDLEAEEEKPLPCPFCGGHAKAEMYGIIAGMAKYRVHCTECDCHYSSPICESRDAAISAHNRVAKVMMDVKAKEDK